MEYCDFLLTIRRGHQVDLQGGVWNILWSTVPDIPHHSHFSLKVAFIVVVVL